MPLDIFCQLHCPAVIEPSTIDQRSIAWQTKQTRPRITGLRLARDRTNFDKAETQCCQRLHCCSILVKTCRESQGIRERQTKTFEPAERRERGAPGNKFPGCPRAQKKRK